MQVIQIRGGGLPKAQKNRKGKNSVPPKSEKHDNFQRIAENRVNNILEGLRKLSNLSSPNYEYEEDEIERIFDTIEEHVSDVRSAFRKPIPKGKKFRL